jgi:hypothetical protein
LPVNSTSDDTYSKNSGISANDDQKALEEEFERSKRSVDKQVIPPLSVTLRSMVESTPVLNTSRNQSDPFKSEEYSDSDSDVEWDEGNQNICPSTVHQRRIIEESDEDVDGACAYV